MHLQALHAAVHCARSPACSCACALASPLCLLRMATAAAATRRSTRASQQPVSLAEEQANEALSSLELRDVAAALRLSLRGSWEEEDVQCFRSLVSLRERLAR